MFERTTDLIMSGFHQPTTGHFRTTCVRAPRAPRCCTALLQRVRGRAWHPTPRADHLLFNYQMRSFHRLWEPRRANGTGFRYSYLFEWSSYEYKAVLSPACLTARSLSRCCRVERERSVWSTNNIMHHARLEGFKMRFSLLQICSVSIANTVRV